MGAEGTRPSGVIFDEARIYPTAFTKVEPEHRAIDHLFEHDANEESHQLASRTILGKRFELSWSWMWMDWELGPGVQVYARKGAWKPREGDLLDVWLNLGPLSLLLEVKSA
jgi:hypothetical protein